MMMGNFNEKSLLLSGLKGKIYKGPSFQSGHG